VKASSLLAKRGPRDCGCCSHLEQRPLKGLDNPPARRKNEFFWRPEDLARHLQLGAVGTIRDLLAHGLVTDADGWIKVGEMDRFISRVVKARIEAGLFGKGLDREGKPAQPGGSRSSSRNISQLAGSPWRRIAESAAHRNLVPPAATRPHVKMVAVILPACTISMSLLVTMSWPAARPLLRLTRHYTRRFGFRY
jgi:hypothetical protein